MIVMLLALLAAIPQAAIPTPQSRPDFSGTWTVLPDPTPHDPKPGELSASNDWGREVLLKQTTDWLYVEYTSGGRSHARVKLAYRLDGVPTTNVDAASVRPQERTSTAAWEGSTLVITNSVDWPDGTGNRTPRVTREALIVESPAVLRLDVTLSFRGQTGTRTLRYRRSPG